MHGNTYSVNKIHVQVRQVYLKIIYTEKKEEIWLSPMTKAPTPTEMSKGQSERHIIGFKLFIHSSMEIWFRG